VIGAGHNGLACAAVLAGAGRKVLVLEAAAEAGGAARNREFAPATRRRPRTSCTPARALAPSCAGRALACAWRRRNLATHALSAGSGADHRFCRRPVSGVPDDEAARLRALQAQHVALRRRRCCRSFQMVAAEALSSTPWSQKLEFMKLAWRIRSMGREDMRELMRIVFMNIYDLLDEYFDNEALQGAIALDACLGAEWGRARPGTGADVPVSPVRPGRRRRRGRGATGRRHGRGRAGLLGRRPPAPARSCAWARKCAACWSRTTARSASNWTAAKASARST
jgi:glycine/D-amino acid oxidase-like deaminating enzyme